MSAKKNDKEYGKNKDEGKEQGGTKEMEKDGGQRMHGIKDRVTYLFDLGEVAEP